jgi:hypothetical protein
MTKCFVVTEGKRDEFVLRTLLHDVVASTGAQITVASGRNSAASLARTILVNRPARVALAVDADASQPRQVQETEADLVDILADVASRDRFGVFLFVPSIEACLFQDVDGLRRRFGSDLTAELLIRSEYDPRAVLDRLLGKPCDLRHLEELVQQLNHDQLRNHVVLRRLEAFLQAPVVADPGITREHRVITAS